MSTWSSRIGKFLKKDPNHGLLGKKIKNWFIKLFQKCKCGCCCKGRSAAWYSCVCFKDGKKYCNNPDCKCSE